MFKIKESLFILPNTVFRLDLIDLESPTFFVLIFVRIHFSYVFCNKWDWKIKHMNKREYGYEEKALIFYKKNLIAYCLSL